MLLGSGHHLALLTELPDAWRAKCSNRYLVLFHQDPPIASPQRLRMVSVLLLVFRHLASSLWYPPRIGMKLIMIDKVWILFVRGVASVLLRWYRLYAAMLVLAAVVFRVLLVALTPSLCRVISYQSISLGHVHEHLVFLKSLQILGCYTQRWRWLHQVVVYRVVVQIIGL